MLPTKIAVIGAGSASFGLNTVAALLGSQRLRGSHVALVDRNVETLALMARLAERLNREWDAQMTITSHTHHVGTVTQAIHRVAPRARIARVQFEPAVGAVLLAYDALGIAVNEDMVHNLAQTAPGPEFFSTHAGEPSRQDPACHSERSEESPTQAAS